MRFPANNHVNIANTPLWDAMKNCVTSWRFVKKLKYNEGYTAIWFGKPKGLCPIYRKNKDFKTFEQKVRFRQMFHKTRLNREIEHGGKLFTYFWVLDFKAWIVVPNFSKINELIEKLEPLTTMEKNAFLNQDWNLTAPDDPPFKIDNIIRNSADKVPSNISKWIHPLYAYAIFRPRKNGLIKE